MSSDPPAVTNGVPLPLTGITVGAALLAAGTGFGVALSGRSGPFPIAGLAGLLGDGFLAPVAIATLVIGLLALVLLRRTYSDPLLATLLVGQAALLATVPAMLVPGFERLGGGVAAAIATATFVLALRFIYRHKQLPAAASRYLLEWAFSAVLLGAAGALWAIDQVPLGFVPAIAVGFGLATTAALRGPPGDDDERLPWLLHASWSFQLLLYTFLAEFFFGALLDYEIAGPGFLQYIPFVPIPPGAAAALPAVYDGLWFASAILASAWFLILLGITLGTLLALRIRETHEPAQRYRMGLTIATFALAAVYVPSFASSTPLANVPWLANVPIVGWGFGLRAGGPFESGVFLAVLIMYAFVGSLTLLFGRKALCSVMCGAALLYQAGPVNEMRTFNQRSRVGRYLLGSQLSTAYTVAAGLALASLFAISVLGLLHLLPTVQVANGQQDTSALPLPIELYFGGLWFVMFVSTPYLGTYNCATTGVCHWGALSLPFARIGFFRLKVKDRSVCQACTTFDCARACPVGLVDVPLHFRERGEYRSSKCCGVGDCVGACPYGNLYHQDVRRWLRRRISPAARPTVGPTLPMLRQPAAAPTPAPATATVGRP